MCLLRFTDELFIDDEPIKSDIPIIRELCDVRLENRYRCEAQRLPHPLRFSSVSLVATLVAHTQETDGIGDVSGIESGAKSRSLAALSALRSSCRLTAAEVPSYLKRAKMSQRKQYLVSLGQVMYEGLNA